MARPPSDPDIAAYLQWRVQEWVKSKRPAGQLAKAAGVSKAQISNLLNSGVGAGWKTMNGLAKAFGMTMPELMTVAKEWAAEQPLPPPSPTQAAERRKEAAKLCEADGIADEVIASVLDEPLRAEDANKSTVWWIKRIIRRDTGFADAAPRRK
jgi:transcriptional regulator with XRE-family HTH domain